MKRMAMAGAAWLLLAALLTTTAAAAPRASAPRELHWYCTRNRDHCQMQAAPELRFVEEYEGYYVDRAHGDKDAERVVYLTFDAGYENGNVEKVLDTLRETGTTGAFFVLEHLVTAYPALIRRMNEEGHLVCNHTAKHKNLAHATREEIQAEIGRLEEVYRAATGREIARYFRPPEGSFSREMLACVRDMGYKTIFWSFAYADWDNDRQPAEKDALRCILDNVHNGAVILLHPTSATNAAILPALIAALREQGYRFGSLDELCGGQ